MFFIIFFVALVFTQTAYASEQVFRLGATYHRWVLTEKDLAHDGGTLLLVVDAPETQPRLPNAVSQRVVLRKTFSKADETELNKTINYYEDLKDIASSDQKSFYKNFPTPTNQPIWTLKKKAWTLEDELDYGSWITNSVNADIFVGSGIPVDCADFAVALRWVYAHDHGLPVANSLAGTGGLVGQWSGDTLWDNLPTDSDWHNDKKFKVALKYILNSTYTHSIKRDLYPVELTRNYVTPGSIDLVLYSSTTGHTQVIFGIGKDPNYCDGTECITVIYGNEPAREKAYRGNAWITNSPRLSGGFLRWKWPVQNNGVWSFIPATSMPGYSLKQYDHQELSDSEFQTFVYQELGLRTDDTSRAIVSGNAFKEMVDERIGVTELGYYYCSLTPCDPAGPLYDAYSTPNRDKRMKEIKNNFTEAAAKVPADDTAFNQFIESLKSPVIQGYPLSYLDLITNKDQSLEKLDADPTHIFFARWGLYPSLLDNQFQTLAFVWMNNWNNRDDLVKQAQSFCFPSGSSKPNCDVRSEKFKSLETSIFDQGFRQSRTLMLSLLSQVKPETVQTVYDKTRHETPAKIQCLPQQPCTYFDFALSDKPFVTQMTSVPSDTLKKRYGLK